MLVAVVAAVLAPWRRRAAAESAPPPVDKPGAARAVPGLRRQRARPVGERRATTSTSSPAAAGSRSNPVPADRARWGRFDELTERNQADAARDPGEGGRRRSAPLDRQIGDYYAACMDEAGIEKHGPAAASSRRSTASPAIKTKAELARRGRPPARARASSALFGFGSQPDFKDATKVHRGRGPGRPRPARPRLLPEGRARASRTCASSTRPTSQRMFELPGDAPRGGAEAAQTRPGDRDRAGPRVARAREAPRPRERLPPMTKAELAALAPAFDWDAYFAAVGAPRRSRSST